MFNCTYCVPIPQQYCYPAYRQVASDAFQKEGDLIEFLSSLIWGTINKINYDHKVSYYIATFHAIKNKYCISG